RIGRDVLVALLDQQPFLLGLLELDERPAAAELVALQVEQQLALLESLMRVLERLPDAAVPDDDGARAVVAFRNHALEVAVLERVILDFHGEPFVGGIGGGSFWNGP